MLNTLDESLVFKYGEQIMGHGAGFGSQSSDPGSGKFESQYQDTLLLRKVLDRCQISDPRSKPTLSYRRFSTG